MARFIAQTIFGRPVEVDDAEVVGSTGDYAVHRALDDRSLWAVSHMPSGRTCLFGVCRAVALEACVEFDRVLGLRLRGVRKSSHLAPDVRAEGKEIMERFRAKDDELRGTEGRCR